MIAKITSELQTIISDAFLKEVNRLKKKYKEKLEKIESM